MSFFSPMAPVASRTLRVLARLLSYPDATLRRHLGELATALQTERALSATRLAKLEALMAVLSGRQSGAEALAVEAAYVEVFDRGRPGPDVRES